MKKTLSILFIISISIFILFTTKYSVKREVVEISHVVTVGSESYPRTVKTIPEEKYYQYRYNKMFLMEDPKEKITEYLAIMEQFPNMDYPTKLEEAFTEDEIYLMARCVETEVYQRDFVCRTNVSCVIFNRLNDSRFPDEVNEVITPGQFAFSRTTITEDTYLAIQYAWYFGAECGDALWFHSYSEPIEFFGTYTGYSDTAVHHFYH